MCRIVLNADPAWAKAVQEVSAAGCAVHLLPAGSGQLYMHEKMLLTDGVTLTIGSQNRSTASLLEDREFVVTALKAAGPVIEAVESTFDHDYDQAPAA